LTDHLKRVHELSAAEAKSRTTVEKKSAALSPVGVSFFVHAGDRWYEKNKHLTMTNAHPELKVSVMITIAI